ncbi:hypothetical protein RND81_02G147300 [Saponaria officinalis]
MLTRVRSRGLMLLRFKKLLTMVDVSLAVLVRPLDALPHHSFDLSINADKSNIWQGEMGARQIYVARFFSILYFYSFRVLLRICFLIVFNFEYISKSCKIVMC